MHTGSMLAKRPVEVGAPFPQFPGDEAVLLTPIDMRSPEGLSLQLVQPKAPHSEPRQDQKTRLPSACDDRTVTEEL